MGKSIYFNWWKKLFYLTENLMPFYFLRWVRDYQGIRAQVLLERYSWHILHCIYRCIWHESITVCNWVIRGQTGLHMLLWLERRERKKLFFFLQRNSNFYELAKKRNGPHWWNPWSFAYGQLYLIDTWKCGSHWQASFNIFHPLRFFFFLWHLKAFIFFIKYS